MRILTLLLLSIPLNAQFFGGGPAKRIRVGSGNPTATNPPCAALGDPGNVYINNDASAGADKLWHCRNNNGTIAWAQSSVTGLPDPGTNGYIVRTAAGTDVARTFVAGTGVILTNPDGVAAATNIAIDTATVPVKLSTTGVLDFPAVLDGTISADQTITLTGAATADPVLCGPPSTFPARVVCFAWVTAANTVGVRLDNQSGADLSATAADGTYTVTIAR